MWITLNNKIPPMCRRDFIGVANGDSPRSDSESGALRTRPVPNWSTRAIQSPHVIKKLLWETVLSSLEIYPGVANGD